MKKRDLLSFQIVNHIRQHEVCSRRDIAARLGMSLPATGQLIRELLERKMLVSDGFDASTGGRRRARLRLNAAKGCAMGIHVGIRGIRGVLMDLGGTAIAEQTNGGLTTHRVDDTLEAILGAIKGLMPPAASPPLHGIGIGISGIIRQDGSVSREFPYAERWQEVPLADTIEGQCGIRPLLLNDVQAAALGELRLGGAKGLKNVVFLHMGDGIAAGIIANGALCRGGTLNAGEVGHLVINADGPVCYCGDRGCLESMASPRAMVEACRHAVGRGVSTLVLEDAPSPEAVAFEHILRAAARGDRLANNLLAEAGRHLGHVAANLINVFDPEMLMLGGILAGPRNVLIETLERVARSRALPMLRDATRIEASQLTDSASVLGAGAWVLNELFSDPAWIIALCTQS